MHDVESLLKVRPHIGFPHPAYTLLGINNRDLKTMTTDPNHTLRLLEMVENLDILVSESESARPTTWPGRAMPAFIGFCGRTPLCASSDAGCCS